MELSSVDAYQQASLLRCLRWRVLRLCHSTWSTLCATVTSHHKEICWEDLWVHIRGCTCCCPRSMAVLSMLYSWHVDRRRWVIVHRATAACDWCRVEVPEPEYRGENASPATWCTLHCAEYRFLPRGLGLWWQLQDFRYHRLWEQHSSCHRENSPAWLDPLRQPHDT